jgi:hypothetical protein
VRPLPDEQRRREGQARAFHASITATAPNEVLCYDLVHIASEARLDKQRNRGTAAGGFNNSLYP